MASTKLLLVTSEFPPQPGGIGDHAYNLAHHLSLANYEVTVIADQRSESGEEETNFDIALNFKVVRVPLAYPRYKMYYKRLRFLRRSAKDHAVIIASGKFSLWNVALLKRSQSRQRIAVIHGSEVNFTAKLLRYSIALALQQFDHIIAVSEFTKSLVSIRHQRKTIVIPNGFNTEKWEKAKTVQVALRGWPKLITVGHVSERKGQREVINLLPNLIQRYPEITYHCVGLPTEVDACKDLARRLGVEDRVVFHGRVNDNVLKALLQASDVFVMLSTTTSTGDVEGFGIALLEANALGVPTIGAKGCGIEDAIKEGQSGFLVSLRDSLGFETVLNRLLNAPTKYEIGAQNWAAAHHWSLIVKRYLKVISFNSERINDNI